MNFCKPDTFSFQLQYGTYCFATLETTTSPEVLMLHSAPVSDPCNGKPPSSFWRYQPLEAENHPFKPKENHLNQTLHFLGFKILIFRGCIIKCAFPNPFCKYVQLFCSIAFQIHAPKAFYFRLFFFLKTYICDWLEEGLLATFEGFFVSLEHWSDYDSGLAGCWFAAKSHELQHSYQCM